MLMGRDTRMKIRKVEERKVGKGVWEVKVNKRKEEEERNRAEVLVHKQIDVKAKKEIREEENGIGQENYWKVKFEKKENIGVDRRE